ncbi:hypothetical protein PCL_00645 [Purpureocillium lilacinum]|uniref:Uncharacterized protein n=1 Tax=Purpureocillium lilacinum TaxID=33203 RepID=A0A2U3E5H4_PURLI|nr:hypothetical protein PCL_00645 [Purpureocillium lilacinum]
MVPTKRPTGLKPSRRTMSTPLSRPNVTGPTNTHTCLHPLEGQTSIVIHRSGRAETCSEPRGSAYIHPHPSADDGNGTRTSKRPSAFSLTTHSTSAWSPSSRRGHLLPQETSNIGVNAPHASIASADSSRPDVTRHLYASPGPFILRSARGGRTSHCPLYTGVRNNRKITQPVSRTQHRRHMHAGRAIASLRVRLSLVRSGEAIPGPNPGISHEQGRLLVHDLCMNLVAEIMLAVQPDSPESHPVAAPVDCDDARCQPAHRRVVARDDSNFEMATSAGRVTFPPSLFLSREALLFLIKELPARESPSSPSSIFWRSYAGKGADNGLTQSSNTSGAPMPWTTKGQGHDRVTISPCRSGPLTGAAAIQEASLVTTTSLYTSTMIVRCPWHLFSFRAHSHPLRCPRQRSATLRQPGPGIITTNIRGLVYINNLSHLTSAPLTGVRHECGKTSKPLLPDVVPAHINQKLAAFKGLCILCFDQKKKMWKTESFQRVSWGGPAYHRNGVRLPRDSGGGGPGRGRHTGRQGFGEIMGSATTPDSIVVREPYEGLGPTASTLCTAVREVVHGNHTSQPTSTQYYAQVASMARHTASVLCNSA